MIKSEKLFDVALNEAELICDEDETFCEEIGKNGLKLIEEIYNKKKSTINILTHCYNNIYNSNPNGCKQKIIIIKRF